MTEKKQIYKCEICGNTVEVLHSGAGQLVCCGQPMVLMEEKTEGEGKEKHIPVVEKDNDNIRIKVGSVPHPMESEHYIEWIEVIANGKSFRRFLSPGNPAEAEFKIMSESFKVRIYCNVHGLWKLE